MRFNKAFEKLKEAKDSAVQKLPKPVRRKADDKLGLFIHKYIATLFYFDEEIQEIYWEMEEAVQEGDREKASELSMEMKTVINLKSNEENGVSTRKHRQAINNATDKIQKATEALKGKNKASMLKDFLKISRDEENLEDADLSNDIEEMVHEVEN
jgi:hypothetical protein